MYSPNWDALRIQGRNHPAEVRSEYFLHFSLVKFGVNFHEIFRAPKFPLGVQTGELHKIHARNGVKKGAFQTNSAGGVVLRENVHHSENYLRKNLTSGQTFRAGGTVHTKTITNDHLEFFSRFCFHNGKITKSPTFDFSLSFTMNMLGTHMPQRQASLTTKHAKLQKNFSLSLS